MNRKRPSVFVKFLLPSILLILLPVIICIVFYFSAMQFGRSYALNNIQAMNSHVLEIMERNPDEKEGSKPDGTHASDGDEGFHGPEGSSSQSTVPPAGENTENPAVPADSGTASSSDGSASRTESSSVVSEKPNSTELFLDAVGHYAATNDTAANLLIFSPDFEILHPRDEERLNARTPLAKDFAEAIQSNTLPSDKPFTSKSTGTIYLVSLSQPSERYAEIGYIICYHPLLEAIGWVQDATILILIISAVVSLITFFALRTSVKEMTGTLNRLCVEADRIGGGDFEPIEPSFNLQEPEELRTAMNSMAGRLSRMKKSQEELFANISHKLRNRLMSITGYAQGLEYGVSSPEKAGLAIQKESAALTEEVNKLLSLSRLDDELTPVTPEPVPVIEMLENSMDRFSAAGTQKGVTLRLQKCAEEVYALGNEDFMEDILDNLLSNAIRYAKKEILLSVQKKDDQVILTVADDGDGISEKDLPHIFDRFYKGPDGSFGLGLAIACGAARRMGGSLTAQNSPDGGAVFTLTLAVSE